MSPIEQGSPPKDEPSMNTDVVKVATEASKSLPTLVGGGSVGIVGAIVWLVMSLGDARTEITSEIQALKMQITRVSQELDQIKQDTLRRTEFDSALRLRDERFDRMREVCVGGAQKLQELRKEFDAHRYQQGAAEARRRTRGR